ncbi:NTP transferase domain-containing protein [Aestuariibius insulae]|uniref:nucleotidyltransferase family protein n=1 Tax=Aestuariibius insulae TaxID=2058287 RepID=UPI00345E7D52
MTKTIPILLLAAGASTRMRGRDKLLERIDGRPLLLRQTDAALATGHPVFVALPDLNHARSALLADHPVTRIPCSDSAEGLSGTLRNIISALPEDTSAALLLLADLPEITASDIETVLTAQTLESDALIWRGATQDRHPGHPILIAAQLFPEFQLLTGDTGGQPVLKRHTDRTVLVPLPGNRARLDLDTPEDWADWRASRTR